LLPSDAAVAAAVSPPPLTASDDPPDEFLDNFFMWVVCLYFLFGDFGSDMVASAVHAY
jgi:hypothetical protein